MNQFWITQSFFWTLELMLNLNLILELELKGFYCIYFMIYIYNNIIYDLKKYGFLDIINMNTRHSIYSLNIFLGSFVPFYNFIFDIFFHHHTVWYISSTEGRININYKRYIAPKLNKIFLYNLYIYIYI